MKYPEENWDQIFDEKGDNINMKIVVLNGSPRKGGNTEIMTQAFTKGAEKKGHEQSTYLLVP